MQQKSNNILSSKERILLYLDNKEISQYDFSKKTGLSNGFLKSGSSISSENLKLLSNIYSDLNIMWVITGEGSMLKNSKKLSDSSVTNDIHPVTCEFTTFTQRFEYLINYFADGDKEKFAEMAGIHIIDVEKVVGTRGRINPPFSVLQSILYAFEYINPKWLLAGNGDIFMQNKYSELPREIEEIKKLSKEIGRLEAENSHLQQEILQLKKYASRSVDYTFDDPPALMATEHFERRYSHSPETV
jgi:hypothetical protein